VGRSPLKMSPLRRNRPQFEMDFIAQVFKPPGKSVYGMLSLPLVKVGRPQFAIAPRVEAGCPTGSVICRERLGGLLRY
jgi:hypothetical protein